MTPPLNLEEVFKTNGVPTHTFVEPVEYSKLIVNLRTPGRGLVIEGPSGIGKTSAVETALRQLGLEDKVTKLTARKKENVEYIRELPSLGSVGTVIIDDFHKLPDSVKAALADHLKTLADEEEDGTKLIIVGINNAGQRLISMAHDLVNRIDILTLESNPEFKVVELVKLGEAALNVEINIAVDIVMAAQGSFYIAQMLCLEVCTRSKILNAQVDRVATIESFETVKAQVFQRLGRVFEERCKRFCRGSKLRPEGRAPYLHILNWLAQGNEWSLSLSEAMRQHPQLRGSVGQVVDKQYLDELVKNDEDLVKVLDFDAQARQLTVDDPQFMFYIRNIPWNAFAKDVGYSSVDFKTRYDFALSFAGHDRPLAEALFAALQEEEFEVFYDRNEQHRIAGEDVEEYLLPIYQSEAKFVLPLLSKQYPTRTWTKIEADGFKSRFASGDVIPIRFAHAPPGMFDTANRYGGLVYDPEKELKPQVEDIVRTLKRKMAEARGAPGSVPTEGLLFPNLK